MSRPHAGACSEARVAVIGGGVVGCAVAHALARRGVDALLLEAEEGLALGASGTNSGILHTDFDSEPGTLETRLILRAAILHAELERELGVTVHRCGAELRPRDERQRAAVARLAENAAANGVEARVDERGALIVPGEAVTDPVAYVHALAGAAQAGGARVMLGARVSGLTRDPDGLLALELENGARVRAHAAVNCAGLFADEIAQLADESPVSVYPRKGEFLVFAPPPSGPPARILLPAPSALGKGVLVFPTVDGLLIAGPTARECEDKRDWSVEPDARELILAGALAMFPALEQARELGAYAGLRPAGRERSYVIERSGTLPGLIHAAAIRSTGLSAALGIGEHIVAMLAHEGRIEPGRFVRCRRRRAPPRASTGGSARSATIACARRSTAPPPPRSRAGAPPLVQTLPLRGRRRERPAAARHRRGHDGRQGGAVRPRAESGRAGATGGPALASTSRLGRAGPGADPRGGRGRGRGGARAGRGASGGGGWPRPSGRVGARLGRRGCQSR
ncbi:MAG TPA: FAD-dependent oxidoreductase [Solirubrobacteraceae bacterium]|nr:FAD-dependent oxidoreductase [Solirubrobacteraceae bacterium]